MSALFLMDVKHKLAANQDIFRAKTVKQLVAEIEAQKVEIARLTRIEQAACELVYHGKPDSFSKLAGTLEAQS